MNFKPDKDLQKIISDNISGSAYLLEKLNNYLSLRFVKGNPSDLIPYLKKKFNEFSNIQNYLIELENVIKNNSIEPEKFFNDFAKVRSNDINIICLKCFDELRSFKKFMTISNSYTVNNLLKLFTKDVHDLSLIVCESRPMLEGRILAEELIEFPLKVKLITEAMIANEITNIDAAIIGADSILSNGNVVNKVGSKLLALACHYYNKPFYVVADKSKFINSDKHIINQRPNNEIWDCTHDNIIIENYYFEEVEKKLITKTYSS